MTASAGPPPVPGLPPPASQAAAVRSSAFWLPPDAPPITVGGYIISGGLFYFGSALPAAYAPIYEPALVDPMLPVRRIRLDQETPTNGARISYADLTAGARAAYLEWLAGGRVGPTPVAHLWLFLYGLERRILVDLAGTLGRTEEYAAIGAEIATLRERYHDVAEFDDHAATLADLVSALAGLGDPALRPPPPPRTPAAELPVPLRIGIGRYVARGQPISAAWAYAWYTNHPSLPWDATAVDRPEEHQRGFVRRYAAAYPSGGMTVPIPSHELVLAYQPANPGFAWRTVRIHTQLPDVQALPPPLSNLVIESSAVETARADAAPAGDGLVEVAPPEPPPADDLDLDAVEAAVRRAREQMNSTGGVPQPVRVPAAAADSPPVLPEPAPVRTPYADRPKLAAADALLRLASIAGLSDGQVRAVRRHAVGALGLGVSDRHQLDDGLEEFAHRRPTADVIRDRFGRLERADQDAVADLLIATTGAEGTLEPPLIIVLEAVFALLGQSAGDLHRRLGEVEVASVSFDSEPDAPINTTVLDQDTVDRTLAAAAGGASLVAQVTAPPAQAPPQPRWYATTAGSIITQAGR